MALRTGPKFLRLLALLAAVALVAAACGGDEGDGGGGGGGGDEVTVIHGTTDPPVSYDPSGSYDLPSWNVIYNIMEGVLTIPPGGSVPEPQLAESCDFEDPQTYTCTLKQGVTFHDGSTFDANDVKASLDRNIQIADEESGSYTLLAALATPDTFTGEEIEVVDDYTVTFHLSKPDATWPFILTTGAAYIVPSEYPADALQENTAGSVIGTGRYRLADYRPGEQTVLEAYEDYYGDPPANDRVIIQQFDKSSSLKLAVEDGSVDIAYRNLTPTEIDDLRSAEGIEVVEGNGTEIRYIVFNTTLDPGKELAARKAMALTIDRQSIVTNVYNDTVEPLYSQVPVGIEGHIDAFADEYGESPDVDAAAAVLSDAGVETPVPVELWWTPTHYGDSSADEYTEIERQLEESGLFDVTLKSTEWEEYKTGAFGGTYPVYQLGWFPDFTDADNYTAPFFGTDTNFTGNGYSNPAVDELIAQERAETDAAARVPLFEEIQRIVAQEVPTLPLWQGKQLAAIREGITGVDQTFDPSFQFRYWLISKA